MIIINRSKICLAKEIYINSYADQFLVKVPVNQLLKKPLPLHKIINKQKSKYGKMTLLLNNLCNSNRIKSFKPLIQ